MKKGKLYVISGPSGVGKNTLLNAVLLNRDDIKYSISYTTRSPRKGEIEGKNYFFTTKNDFLKAVENDEFLEWAEFSGNFYGTKQAYVEKELSIGHNIVLEIDTQGALQVKKKITDSVLIFIMPPSVDDLEKRLRGRNTETEDAIKSRLAFANKELERSKLFNYKIVNNNFESAVLELQNILSL